MILIPSSDGGGVVHELILRPCGVNERSIFNPVALLPSSIIGVIFIYFLDNHDCKVIDGVIGLAKMFSHWSVRSSMLYI